MIKYSYTILYVDDVAKSIRFYKDAFGLEVKFTTPDNDYGELLTGNTTLSFASKKLAASNLPNGFIESSIHENPFAIELGFVTEEVATTVEKAILAGATLEAAPKQKPWGQIVAYVRDPDGFLLEICSPMG